MVGVEQGFQLHHQRQLNRRLVERKLLHPQLAELVRTSSASCAVLSGKATAKGEPVQSLPQLSP